MSIDSQEHSGYGSGAETLARNPDWKSSFQICSSFADSAL